MVAVVLSVGAVGAGGGAGVVGLFVHAAVVGGVDLLDDVAVFVVAGDVDGRVLQLLLDVGAGGEDDAARGDERGADVVHIFHSRGAHAEAHGAQPGDGDGVALGGPVLDDVAYGLPRGGDGAFGDARAQGGFADDFLGLQRAVDVGYHDEAILPCRGADGQFRLAGFDFDTHKELKIKN